MTRFRQQKTRFSAICASPGWASAFDLLPLSGPVLKETIGPLLLLLPRPEYRLQAVYGLGVAVSRLALADREAAREIIRRLMWSLNEESGSIGWGAPETMGAILAMSPALAGEYAHIFLSYGYGSGCEDNFIVHPPLRCGVYLGAAMLATANFAAVRPLLPHLAKALDAPEPFIRAAAALVLRQLAHQSARTAPVAAFLDPAGGCDWTLALAAVHEAAGQPGADGALEYLECHNGGRIVSATGETLFREAAEAIEMRLR